MTRGFIDRVKIYVESGNGGNGCVSFRREKFVPRGGPDGGNGGKGGDIVFRVDLGIRTLIDLRYRKNYKAGNGQAGSGARKAGKSGKSVVIRVPQGTLVEDLENGEFLADLTDEEDELVLLEGGRGGRGNYTFRTSRNKAPLRATGGEPGTQKTLKLTMKLIADVGLVGLPNAGKSTLLNTVSAAHPKIASYPFTTLIPTLGIVSVGELASFCMVDIPGLIKGAHEGKGLGIQFLQHIERCRILLFVIDASVPEIEDVYSQLIDELGAYNANLLSKQRIVALNKVDLTEEFLQDNFSFAKEEDVYLISAATGKGIPELLSRLYKVVSESSREEDQQPNP
ncbi:GTPase ObgE [bacterium]|nr:GTPase ObgE [bacterium]